MNKELFIKRIENDLAGLAETLDLTLADIKALLEDEGFYGVDIQKIKTRYGLTYKELCKIFLDVD